MDLPGFLDHVEQHGQLGLLAQRGPEMEFEMPALRQVAGPSIILLGFEDRGAPADLLHDARQVRRRRSADNVDVDGQAADGIEMEQQTRAALEDKGQAGFGEMP